MAFLSEIFGFKTNTDSPADGINEIFPLKIKQDEFIRSDVVHIYSKILTDVIERTSGITEDIEGLLWDNCLRSTTGEGLVSRLARSMSEKTDLFLVYDKAVQVLREATADEKRLIEEDYKSKASSDVGIYVSFKKYTRTDMIKLYASLEYFAINSLYKNMNISKAIQLKMNDLRATVALDNSGDAKAQASAIAKALSEGKDVILDAKDNIVTATPDLTSTKSAIEFIDNKLSFYLGLPASYITGLLTGGIGSTGESDTKAVERGLKSYYVSIIKPVLESLFGISVSYKSQDFRQIAQALEAIKTFELVGDDYISVDQKRLIVAGLLDMEIDP